MIILACYYKGEKVGYRRAINAADITHVESGEAGLHDHIIQEIRSAHMSRLFLQAQKLRVPCTKLSLCPTSPSSSGFVVTTYAPFDSVMLMVEKSLTDPRARVDMWDVDTFPYEGEDEEELEDEYFSTLLRQRLALGWKYTISDLNGWLNPVPETTTRVELLVEDEPAEPTLG